jgi:hypothetical protein
VQLDPRVKTPIADLQRQYDLHTKVRDLLVETHRSVMEIRSVRSQLDLLKKRLASNEKAKSVIEAADAINKKMSPVEEQFIEVKAKASQDMCNYPTMLSSKIAWLNNVVDSSDHAPTKQSYEFYEEMRKWAEREMAKWKDMKAKDIPALNDLMRKENIPSIAAFRIRGTPGEEDADEDADRP